MNKLKAPAIALLCTGIAGLLFTLLDLAIHLVSHGSWWAYVREQFEIPLSQRRLDHLYTFFYVGIWILWVAVHGLCIVAALRLLSGRGWALGIAACAISMIPCITNCCVWPLSFATGVWLLIVLLQGDVRRFLGASPS